MIDRQGLASLLLACFSAVSFTAHANSPCHKNTVSVGATYQISNRTLTGSALKSSQWILWRDANKVAHENVHEQKTAVWVRSADKHLYMTRYFDAHQRGIEYQPSELGRNAEEDNWQRIYALLSEADLDKLQVVSTVGEGCNTVVNYISNEATESLKLSWLPAMQLVQKLQRTTATGVTTWELTQTVESADQIRAAFEQRDAYQVLDFADIGDNESDPFLLQMVNLGFSQPNTHSAHSAGSEHRH